MNKILIDKITYNYHILYDIITQQQKLHTPPTPSIPSLEYCKQHSVLIIAEDTQHQAKRLSCKINQQSCCQKKTLFTTVYFLYKCQLEVPLIYQENNFNVN